MSLITGLFGDLGGWLVAGAAALGAIAVAYFKGRSAGKAKAENTQLKDTLSKVDQINDAASDNAARSDAELRERLLNAQRRK